jgi:cytoskeletal protein CcmA (bactofilin family)
MSCPDQAQMNLYVDGELSADELPALEAHLALCTSCRQLVTDLHTEGDLIGEVLREAALAGVPAPRRAARDLAWAALALAAVTAGVNGGLDALAQLQAQLGWLSPFSEGHGIAALFDVFFWLAQEDILMLFTPIAALVTVLLLGSILALFPRRRSAPAAAAALLLLFVSAPLSATEQRKPARGQGHVVVIPAGETVDDTVVATGRQIVVEGTITGNLIAFGQQVRVPGEVRGSLLAFAKDVIIEGSVGGDVFSASQNLDVRGKVLGSVHAAGADIDIAKGATVARDVYGASEGLRVGGSVGRDLRAVGDVFTVSGEVGRAVSVSGHELDLSTTARIGGDITAYLQSATSFTRAPGAQLAHEPQIHMQEARRRGDRGARSLAQWLRPSFYFWQAVRVAAALGLGLLLYWLVPALFEWSTPPAGRLLRHGGVGFLALVATPAAAILVGITLVGLPIGILALVAWVVALYLSGIFVALMVGRLLLRSPRRNGAAFALALLSGLAVVRIAVNLPFLGGIVGLLVIVVGLGMLVAQLSELMRRLRTPAAV